PSLARNLRRAPLLGLRLPSGWTEAFPRRGTPLLRPRSEAAILARRSLVGRYIQRNGRVLGLPARPTAQQRVVHNATEYLERVRGVGTPTLHQLARCQRLALGNECAANCVLKSPSRRSAPSRRLA